MCIRDRRQGLKKADSILLEPYYEFRMELPSENVGRAMTDIQNMSGKFGTPMIEEETTVLTGSAPVSLMRGYQKEFTAYTGGRGRMAVSLKGYDICHNQEEVLAASTYDSEADLANPTGSVFCAHGAGFVVDWDEVEEYMHMEHTLESGNDEVLTYMKKGVTSQEMIEAAQKVKQAKIRLSVTAISGLGGRRLWKEHAKDTGLVLSQMKPDYIGLLTLMIEEDLPLADKIRSGEFELLNPYDILIETKEMLKYMDCPDCIFRSNHASNYVNLRGTLNQDKEAMINLLDEAIKGNVHLKSEWMRGL